MNEDRTPLLEVDNLQKHFPITTGLLKQETGQVRAVDGISFELNRGETFGLVGESGCGKSTAAKAIMHLIKPTDGTVRFEGRDVGEMGKSERRMFRRRAQIIFQDPDSSFDPRMTIGDSVAEPLRVNGMRDRERRRDIVAELLKRVGLDERDAERYPHEFSGGQKQRIGLARALALNPDLLVADEPVSALDVSIQAEILSLMQDLQDEFDLAILIISHNLGVIRQICDRIGVMYVGELVERGPAESVFENPQHPYTRALLESMPRPDPRLARESLKLTGAVPSPENPPSGCRFHTRCPMIIQPQWLDLDQSEWRRIMDVVQRVYSSEINPEGIRQSVIAMENKSIEGPEEVGYPDFDQRLREDYGVPQQIESGKVEEIFSDAVKAVYENNLDLARQQLEEAFATPCRSKVPVESSVERDHMATCHLLEVDDREPPAVSK